MRTTRLLSTFAVTALLAGLMAAPTLAAPSMQGGNLLQDPSFEQAASGNWKWQWWQYENIVYNDDKKKDPNLNESFYAPSFAPTTDELKWDKESNGTSGAAGAVKGQKWRKFRAGFYQTVDVAAGSRVRFSVWGNGFCQMDDGTRCAVKVRAGIDPDGGANWQSGSIQWGGEAQVGDQKYVQLSAPEVTVGASGKVTVFTQGEPTYPAIYNAAYFDEASLVVTAAPAVTPTGVPPTARPTVPPAPAPCAQMRFVSDVTIPDDSRIAPGAQFVKTWRIKNVGTCAWAGTLNFVGTGNRMGGTSPTSFPPVPVGQEAELSISLTAPAQLGPYQGTWQVRTTDGVVLDNLFLKIIVAGEAAPPVAAVTATPQSQAPVPSATPTPGQICVLAFNDRNGDGQQGADENPLAGVAFALADSNGPKDTYTTDGVSEPYCFANLQPGSYTLTAKAPSGYGATSPKTQITAISGGKEDFVFGARRGGAVPTPTRTSSGGAGSGAASGLLGGVGRYILVGAALLVLIGLGFVGGFVLMNRR